jgi:DNA-binding GntR family transcriptional regulator
MTMRERSYLHIQSQISTGQLPAGAPISELVLAKELGSSRTPIREAIGQLVAEGLLEQTPTGTTLVVRLQRQDIIELYELREALETYVIEKVARSAIHETDRERLQQLVSEIRVLQHELDTSGARALDASQMNRFLASDFAFHSMLMSMAHNSRIQKVLNEMRLLIRIFSIQRRGHEKELLDTIHKHHQQILDSVVNQDPGRARQLLAEHIRTSLQERLDEFDHWRRERSFRESMPTFLEPFKNVVQDKDSIRSPTDR